MGRGSGKRWRRARRYVYRTWHTIWVLPLGALVGFFVVITLLNELAKAAGLGEKRGPEW